tara:strand:- start:77 stop:1192 length:1116 start_codon:yes stop_codon:yes gene_type:complete
MDPFTTALLASAAAQGVGALSGAGNKFMAGRANALTDEQRKRLKELERLEALNQFGMTGAQREQYTNQALTPVQAAERQALAQFGASQSIGDIGQGAAFRQQQAITEGSEEARAKIAQAVAMKEAQASQEQARQLEALQGQERKSKELQRSAAFDALSGVAGAVGGALATKAEFEATQSLYDKKLSQLSGQQAQTVSDTQSMFGITPNSQKTPEERQDTLGQPISDQPPASGVDDLTNGERALQRFVALPENAKAQRYIQTGDFSNEVLPPQGYAQYEQTFGGSFPNPLFVTTEERLDMERLQAQDIANAMSSEFKVGTEIKSSEGWGYKIIANDRDGNPIFTFVKKDGSTVGKFGKGTEQYDQAFKMGKQ